MGLNKVMTVLFAAWLINFIAAAIPSLQWLLSLEFLLVTIPILLCVSLYYVEATRKLLHSLQGDAFRAAARKKLHVMLRRSR